MAAQAWLDRRLSGISPNSFAERIVIFGFQLQPPRDFGDSWCVTCCSTGGVQRPDNYDALSAILIFASPFQEDHVEGIRSIVMAVGSWAVGDAGGPVLLWVPHTAAPDERAPGLSVDVDRDKFVVDIMGLGLDGVIAEEPEGLELVLAVRMQMQRVQTLLKAFNLTILEQHKTKVDLEFYQDCIENAQWDFVREKLGSKIPPSDPTLDQGRIVPGYAFGRLLATGRRGATYLLEPVTPEGGGCAAPAGGLQVVKVIDKSTITHVEDLKRLNGLIEIMQLLSDERWRHPNVARLNQVYHSKTQILFRMDCGGAVALSRWLLERHKPDAAKPLVAADVTEVCRQLLGVVAALHEGPHVCHLDIKPENIILEEAFPIGLKLVEFDCAQVQAAGEHCRGVCGTLPFIAPEVLLMEEHDGMAADVWSAGVVLFEVHCGYFGTEKLLNAPLRQHPAVRACAAGSTRNKIIGACIKVRFAQLDFAGRMVALHGHRCLGALLPAMQPLLNGTCDVHPGRRLSARQALDVMEACVATAAPAAAGPS